jgi:hypothetical protein
MSTYEIRFDEQTYKIRRKAEAYAVAEIAWRLGISVSDFRKTAEIRICGKQGSTEFRPVW